MQAKDAEAKPLLEQQEALDFGPARPRVCEPGPGERKRVLEVLGRAFFDDPVATFLFPDERKRLIGFAGFTGLAIDAFGAEALVLTDDTIAGAAIWQRPSPQPHGFLRQVGLGLRMVWLIRGGLRRAIRLGDFMSQHHLLEPHYYLAVLGTDPPSQGQGIGSALIQPVLDRCDKESMPAYLESSKRENISFYNKHGFEVIEELQVPGGPMLWPMIRRNDQG
ncbi:MAG: GNAT family N-acetyltransferase [bacterium]|nr:GNAT family N-acetyltransferase [bacterium]